MKIQHNYNGTHCLSNTIHGSHLWRENGVHNVCHGTTHDNDPDDLLEEWHYSVEDGKSLDQFFVERLGWTKDEVIHWCETAEVPERG